ncbi:MAG: hypothetical protein JNL58_06735 [Planctomyces sp.]|nr:hypothetical protein [Planctomyces sp.]
MSSEVPALPEKYPSQTSGRRRLLIGVISTLIMLLAGGGLGWHQYQSWQRRQFEKTCRTARDKYNWDAEYGAAMAWTAQFPADPDAWLFLGEAAAKLEKFEEARDALAKVPDTDSRFLLTQLQKAGLEWNELNEPRTAVATYRDIIQRDSRILEAHAHVIAFHAFLMERREMLDAIRTAIAAGAEPRDAYSYLTLADKINVSNGRQIVQRWLAADGNDARFKVSMAVRTAEQIVMTADVEVKEESTAREAEALFRLEEFVKVYPQDLVLLSFLLDYYVEQGKVADVGRLLALAPESASKDHKFWVHRGWYHLTTEDLAEAEKSFQEALKIHPMSAEGRHHYSAVMRLLKRPEQDVQKMQSLAAEGREIRKQVLQLKSSDAITEEILTRLAKYAEACGDTEVHQALLKRTQSPSSSPVLNSPATDPAKGDQDQSQDGQPQGDKDAGDGN